MQMTRSDLDAVDSILAIDAADVPRFVRQCISDRSLSQHVLHLNQIVMSGREEESLRARRALEHLGFA